LVYELLKMQKTGRWQSTAVTSRVLIAIYDYIKTNDLDNLDFTAEVLLNGKNLASGKFYGVASLAEDKEIDFAQEPLASMPKDKELELEFKKDGRGTLFYTASMKYAIPPVKQTARDEGLCVYTEITDAETGEVISESKLESGKIYREKVVISSVIDAEYVALRAPVPAGCEILNSAFVTTGTIPSASSQEESPVRPLAKNRVRPWWYNPNRGLSYKGIYDVEMQYFWDYFPRGIQEVEFTFRASRKGMYNTPCVTAECMYEEEIFGRSSGRVWEIK
ncbi:MAG: alpha-2-macroglobulin, partial [Treponema sp.]|nr:alpha-2-macroglobulin [Treponema sp.]